jgi:hypothetical protein
MTSRSSTGFQFQLYILASLNILQKGRWGAFSFNFISSLHILQKGEGHWFSLHRELSELSQSVALSISSWPVQTRICFSLLLMMFLLGLIFYFLAKKQKHWQITRHIKHSQMTKLGNYVHFYFTSQPKCKRHPLENITKRAWNTLDKILCQCFSFSLVLLYHLEVEKVAFMIEPALIRISACVSPVPSNTDSLHVMVPNASSSSSLFIKHL